MPDPIPVPLAHPDPEWWMRLPAARWGDWSDPCYYCGHVRRLHNPSGCNSASAGMYDSRHCTCTNAAGGSLYRSTRAQPTTV